MSLDPRLQRGVRPLLHVPPELRALIEPDRTDAECDKEPLPAEQPVGKSDDARREERSQLDVVLRVLRNTHRDPSMSFPPPLTRGQTETATTKTVGVLPLNSLPPVIRQRATVLSRNRTKGTLRGRFMKKSAMAVGVSQTLTPVTSPSPESQATRAISASGGLAETRIRRESSAARDGTVQCGRGLGADDTVGGEPIRLLERDNGRLRLLTEGTVGRSGIVAGRRQGLLELLDHDGIAFAEPEFRALGGAEGGGTARRWRCWCRRRGDGVVAVDDGLVAVVVVVVVAG